ncbi:MAG: bifunctional diguanylate cyclase/phosphodiesterase [Desulfovibrio sp.]|nr:bifunctional diguanylate cyclase/phosphodiesterase [Desulfovibrio sp.]
MRSKIYLVLIFSSIIAVIAFFINTISKSVVSHGVNEIELRDAHADMKSLYSLLSELKIRFKFHVYDWAVFDDAYEFLEGKNDKFFTRNFSSIKIEEMHFTASALYNIKGERLAFIDGVDAETSNAWIEEEKQIFNSVEKLMRDNNLENLEGFITVKNIPMIVAAHKIFDSYKEHPTNGCLIIGRTLDSYFIKEAENISGLRFSLLPLNIFNLINGINIDDNIKFLQTKNEIRVYSSVLDLFGKPSFCLELQKPRDIAAFGREISYKNFLLMLVLCVLVLGAGLLMLHFAQRRFTRDEMEYRSKHDSLTGLANNILFLEYITKNLRNIKNGQGGLNILHINIDNFKSINDCYGYRQGDLVLCEMASRLQGLVLKGLVARSGADNFQIAIAEKNPDIVMVQAQSIQSALQKPFEVHGNLVRINTSIGITDVKNNHIDAKTLTHQAELAMFTAKNKGGNTIAFFNQKMRTSAFDKKQLEIALHLAVENNAFSVYYQPKVDIEKQDVAGCEALARWQASNGNWVSPMAFIPIAEENGLITNIDMFVLRSACRQVLAWEKDGYGAVPIAVNMSVRSILSAGFANKVIQTLEEEGTPPSLIDIEITESSFMSDMNRALEAISRLHEAGLRIALDDFGTGYSSLQYLSAMPISFLKIDKKFVDDIFSGKEAAQPLVKSIISLANSLGMHTISEGVEDKEQLAFLVGNGAHVIQGYLFSKPLNTEDCGEYLRNRKARIAAVMQSL